MAKVLISAYSCDPYGGSEGAIGWNWAYFTALSGQEVWCITDEQNRKNIERKLPSLNIKNLNFIYVNLPSWVKKYIYINQPGVYIYYFIWQYAAFKKAKHFDKEIDFNLVHHVSWASFQLGSSMWRLKKPLIYGPCGGGQTAPYSLRKYFYDDWKSEVKRTKVSKLFVKYNPNFKKTMKTAKVIFATNKETYDLAKNLGYNQVEILLDAALSEEFYPLNHEIDISNKKLKILWVGSLVARKGLPIVLEALGVVKNEIDFELTILGDGPMKEYLPQWIEQNGLQGKVNWKGQVPWSEVRENYAGHNLFMFCSLRDSSAHQLLEAMAFKLPIITFNLHGARNLVPDDAGIKVDVSSPEVTIKNLANGLKYFYENPTKRKIYGKNGYDFARAQTWKSKVDIAIKYYDSI